MQMKHVEHKWTAQDIPSQEGRLAVVTGATSGVGFYTAKELARKRATVVMPARDMRKAKAAAERIEAEVPKARLYLADLIFAFELHRRLSAANSCIASIAAHPGWALTDIGRSTGLGFRILMKLSRPHARSELTMCIA